MRVLFLTLYPDTAASTRYRVSQFLPYLRANGVECTIDAPLSNEQFTTLTGPGRKGRPLWYHLAETPRRIVQLLGAHKFDIVVVQKAIMSAYLRGMGALLRNRAKRIVYDLDDAVHLTPPHPLRSIWKTLEDPNQSRKLFRMADLVLAGNTWLAEAAQTNGAPRAEVLPTVVDTDRFAPAATASETYRIGWIGNPSTTPALEVAREALAGIDQAEVCLVGADADHACLETAEVKPWTLETEVAEIQRFSVGIMPLAKTEWTRGKCALKALQYMACRVPCIATPYGAVRDIIRHEENGLFADTPEEWRAALDSLRDPDLRKKLGAAGRATVEQHFSLDAAAPRMLSLLESVL